MSTENRSRNRFAGNSADGVSRRILLRMHICTILFGILLIVLVFSLFRIGMFLLLSDFSQYEGRGQEVFRMFNYGLRYDIRLANACLVLPTILGFILLLWPRAILLFIKKSHAIHAILLLAAFIASACNYFYIKTYGNYLDLFLFGLFEEDTRAVLTTIVTDYPVIPFLLAICLVAYGANRLARSGVDIILSHPWKPLPVWVELLCFALFLTAYGYGIHGTLGRYPLERRDAHVSSLQLLNALTPNAFMALNMAVGDHQKERQYPPATDKEGAALFSTLLGRQVPEHQVSLDQFMQKTPRSRFLEENPPHVVFAVMESMSTHLLTLDSLPDNDLLGDLRPFWQRDFTFTRFLSDGNGTMESLARILVSSPVANISQTRVQKVPFVSNLLKPYKYRGYRTLFITSGNGSWRNIANFLKELGFDEVVEQSDLLREYPEAKSNTWGTYDEFTFRYAEKRLHDAENSHQKLFVMILSITNHPPYTVPDRFKKSPKKISNDMTRRLSALSYPAESILETFRYANDTIGKFISRVEGADIGRHTIVAVTGDHNIRGVPYTDPAEAVLALAVPFYLHLPEPYRDALAVTYDPERVGSHKDILPTLYALSLSDTPHFSRGVNLLARDVESPWYFGFNESMVITPAGAFTFASPGIYFPWSDSGGLRVAGGARMDEALMGEYERFTSYKALLNWQLCRQVNRQP